MIKISGNARLVQDPTTKTVNGQEITEIVLAFDDGKKPSIFVRGTIWDERQAKIAAAYLKKGRMIFVDARLHAPSAYMRRDGTPGASLEATVTSFEFVNVGQQQPAQPAQPTAPQAAPRETNYDKAAAYTELNDPDLPW